MLFLYHKLCRRPLSPLARFRRRYLAALLADQVLQFRFDSVQDDRYILLHRRLCRERVYLVIVIGAGAESGMGGWYLSPRKR